ncbi:MAG: LexA family transcriptional regulator [Flexilinea sp.]|nr:LexA family transcriptional regulator [Flexilinea sp.]
MNNIKLYRIKAGLTQSEFAEKMKVGQSAVSQWESGKRIPPLETFIKIAEALEVSPEMLIDAKIDNKAWREIKLKQVPDFTDKAFIIPLVATLRCGYNTAGQPSYDAIQKIELPLSYKYRYGSDIVAVKAIGQSMLPTIRPGDLLISKPGDAWDDGQIVVINVDDSDTIKRIYHAKDKGLDLVPDNPSFRTLHLSPKEILYYPPHVLGRIVRNMGQDL